MFNLNNALKLCSIILSHYFRQSPQEKEKYFIFQDNPSSDQLINPDSNRPHGQTIDQSAGTGSPLCSQLIGQFNGTKSDSIDEIQKECDGEIERLLECISIEDLSLLLNCIEETVARIRNQYEVNEIEINLIRQFLRFPNANFINVREIASSCDPTAINSRELSLNAFRVSGNATNILLNKCSNLTIFMSDKSVNTGYLPPSITKLILESRGNFIDM
ncbi:MAG: hypothetical protein LBI69_01910 [Puniceicoccales bacterium]|nr:hypothetical protein [Puniceicoccales bacterium]